MAGGKTFNLFVTHLGNGGPIVQQEAVVGELAGLPNVIAMGNFNFRPDSAQYRLTWAALDDAWLAKWPQGIDDHGLNPVDRIDRVFLTPDMAVKDARYLGHGREGCPLPGRWAIGSPGTGGGDRAIEIHQNLMLQITPHLLTSDTIRCILL